MKGRGGGSFLGGGGHRNVIVGVAQSKVQGPKGQTQGSSWTLGTYRTELSIFDLIH